MFALLNKAKSTEFRDSGTKSWDQRLYETVFRESPGTECRTFGFLLSERRSTFRPGTAIGHVYCGIYRVLFEPNEYCDVSVSLSFCERGGDDPTEQTPFGYVHIGQVMSDSKRGYCPSIHLLVRETGHLSEQFSSLFVDVKASGGAGIKAVFNVDLNSILGQDAKSVWGSWGRSNKHLPGRKNFPFKWVEFGAYIK